MSTTKGIDTKVVAAGLSSATKETDTKTVVLRVLFYLLVAAIIVFNLFPFVWALLSSFRPSSELFSTKLLPTQLTFAHFQAVFKDARFVAGLINSRPRVRKWWAAAKRSRSAISIPSTIGEFSKSTPSALAAIIVRPADA